MNNQWIITIGREFCTGGAEAAKKLAETLNYDYLDKGLIDETAEMLSISKEMVIKQDEKPEAYFDIPPHWYMDEDDPYVSLSQAARVSDVQSSIINKYATKGSCVIVGRCADYVLRKNEHLFRVFFHSDMDKRIARAVKLYNITESEAQKLIKKTDRQRATYYNRNTRKRKWGEPGSYDLYLNLGNLGIDGAVRVIIQELEKRDAL